MPATKKQPRLKAPPKGARLILINTGLMVSLRALLKKAGVTLRWGSFGRGDDMAYVWAENDRAHKLCGVADVVFTALTGPKEFNRRGCIDLLRDAMEEAA